MFAIALGGVKYDTVLFTNTMLKDSFYDVAYPSRIADPFNYRVSIPEPEITVRDLLLGFPVTPVGI